jgi:hypothetical protein
MSETLTMPTTAPWLSVSDAGVSDAADQVRQAVERFMSNDRSQLYAARREVLLDLELAAADADHDDWDSQDSLACQQSSLPYARQLIA